MKIDVLLINPFLTVQADDPAGLGPPLSLAYLAAYLEQKKVKVAILDIAAEGIRNFKKVGKKIRYGLGEKEIIRRIKLYQPKIAGISCSSTLHAFEAYQTAKIVKKANPHILVVMGGAHPSIAYREVLRNKHIDIVVRGEGEITLWNIVKRYKNNQIPTDILGTTIQHSKKIIHNPPRPLIQKLDILPFPSRHLLNMDIYLKETEKNNYLMKNRVYTMITSRGCPNNCRYCSVRTIWGRSWRARSPNNIIDELECLIKNYQAQEIHFMDDNMAIDNNRLLKICEEIITRKIKIKWTTPNGIAIWNLNKNIIEKMKQAGCYRLTFGLESGNIKILNKYIGKYYNYDKAKEIISFAAKIGLWTIGTFIIGFPFETGSQIEDTIKFAISTELDFAVFYLANPFPGTPMYQDYLREGFLPNNSGFNIVRGCRTKYFTHGQLIKLQAIAFNRFMQSRLKKPWRFLNKIKSWEELIYTYKLGKNLFKILINQSLVEKKGIAALWK